MTASDTFTKAEIEAWLSAEGKRAEAADWAEAYKFGFAQGLVAVMARMDDEIKRRRVAV